MYKGYVTPLEYFDLGYNNIPADDLEKTLIDASRQIDSLTFNRIVECGYEKLSDFQQQLVQHVVCEHANFLNENKDELSSPLHKYSINGVAMEWGSSPNMVYVGGIPIETRLYSLLEQTGLCCRLAI